MPCMNKSAYPTINTNSKRNKIYVATSLAKSTVVHKYCNNILSLYSSYHHLALVNHQTHCLYPRNNPIE